ncbi:unnamed protein product [Bemisia tabaci]|uniref:Mediator of RNA polymerase II transcription subunit 9 n=1 Tax=Bemisia tabaci TaxID=7038 RepID=A0A9P0A0Q9_BEMTA|nr:unnamed protein product [Bemisia tabaci]
METNSVSENQEQTRNNSSQVSVKDIDVDFLALIYDIIRSSERDSHDTSQKSSQSQDASQKILELHAKLNQAREQIRHLPGVECNKSQQLEKIQVLKTQLLLKQELLQKYWNMSCFDYLKE